MLVFLFFQFKIFFLFRNISFLIKILFLRNASYDQDSWYFEKEKVDCKSFIYNYINTSFIICFNPIETLQYLFTKGI